MASYVREVQPTDILSLRLGLDKTYCAHPLTITFSMSLSLSFPLPFSAILSSIFLLKTSTPNPIDLCSQSSHQPLLLSPVGLLPMLLLCPLSSAFPPPSSPLPPSIYLFLPFLTSAPFCSSSPLSPLFLSLSFSFLPPCCTPSSVVSISSNQAYVFFCSILLPPLHVGGRGALSSFCLILLSLKNF